MVATKLSKYQGMRDFSQTAEPSGKDAKVVPSQALRFVIDPLSLTRIDRLADGWRVISVNA